MGPATGRDGEDGRWRDRYRKEEYGTRIGTWDGATCACREIEVRVALVYSLVLAVCHTSAGWLEPCTACVTLRNDSASSLYPSWSCVIESAIASKKTLQFSSNSHLKGYDQIFGIGYFRSAVRRVQLLCSSLRRKCSLPATAHAHFKY